MAGLGIATLVVLAVSHLLAAAAVRGVAGALLGLAGLSGLGVAAFRTGCPLGAAGCGFGANDMPPDLADAVHPLAVVAYEVALLAAMVVVAGGALRAGRPGWALLTAAAAVVSVLLLLQVGGPGNGWWQRGWLLVNTGWLVVAALSRRARPSPRPAGSSPDGRAASPGRPTAR